MITRKRITSIAIAFIMACSAFTCFSVYQTNTQAAYAASKCKIKITSAVYYKSSKKTVVKYKITGANVPKGYHSHIVINDPASGNGKDGKKKKGSYTMTIKGKVNTSKKPNAYADIKKGSNINSTISSSSKKLTIKK